MTRKRMATYGAAVLLCVSAGILFVPTRAVPRIPLSAEKLAQLADQEAVPSFHSEVPKGPLPATMNPQLFNDVLVQNAYSVAARVKRVLYQLPCYCHCDRSQGHGSLLDCFAGKHAAECGVCIREGFYSYEQTKKGKTAAQIRDGIEKGEWQQVDLSKYQTPLATK